jgi:uncharacterized protein YlxP (DUF503 family)
MRRHILRDPLRNPYAEKRSTQFSSAMFIGSLQITFRLHGVFSKKQKRGVANSLKQKLRNSFNVSVSEIAEQESLDFLVLGIVTLATDTRSAHSAVQKILNKVEATASEEITEISTEVFHA